jgi:ATP-dependent RNA helicase HelY
MFSEYPAVKILQQLERDNLLPTILFRTARRQCDVDLERLQVEEEEFLPTESQNLILQTVDEIIAKYDIPRDVIYSHVQFIALTKIGAGAHHAGQLLAWRLLLEELMSRGLLRMLIATGTVAAGVDFPARSVIITAHSKRGTEGFAVLSSSEFMQMSGRAGRRGKDAVGICITAPSQFSDARVIHEIAQKPPEALNSAYYASPSTVLNLLKHRSKDELKFTVSKSFATFLDKQAALELRTEAASLSEKGPMGGDIVKFNKRVNRLVRDADLVEGRQVRLLDSVMYGLERLGYVDELGLTEKGVWAAELCTNLVLELGEAVAEFVFEDLSPELLAGAVAAICGDSYRNYLDIGNNPVPKNIFRSLEAVVERVGECYQNSARDTVTVAPDASLTVITWIKSQNWTEFSALIRLGGVAEGDAARLIMQTADHLNQLSRLFNTHPELSRTASEARRILLRPPLIEGVAI